MLTSYGDAVIRGDIRQRCPGIQYSLGLGVVERIENAGRQRPMRQAFLGRQRGERVGPGHAPRHLG